MPRRQLGSFESRPRVGARDRDPAPRQRPLTFFLDQKLSLSPSRLSFSPKSRRLRHDRARSLLVLRASLRFLACNRPRAPFTWRNFLCPRLAGDRALACVLALLSYLSLSPRLDPDHLLGAKAEEGGCCGASSPKGPFLHGPACLSALVPRESESREERECKTRVKFDPGKGD